MLRHLHRRLQNQLSAKEDEITRLKHQLQNKQDKIHELENHLIHNESGFIFSIIIAIFNTEKYLSEAIDSILNQNFPLDKIQVILINDGSTDGCEDICKQYVEKYPDNFVYQYQENQGQSIARNNGLKIAEGKFINFLDSDDKLELNCLEEVYYHFLKFGEEIDVISIPRYLFGEANGFIYFEQKYKKNRIVDINEEYDFPQVSISASFIRKNAFSEYFDERVIISEDSLLLNSIILKKCKFGVVGSTKYLYRKRKEHNSTIDTKKTRIEYFNPRMEFYFKKLIQNSIERYGRVLKYIQFVLMYDIQWLLKQSTEVGVLNDDDKNKFYCHIFDVLQEIDDDIILSQQFNFNKFLRYHIINFKYSHPNFSISNGQDVKMLYEDNTFDILSNYKVIFSQINRNNDSILINGFFKFYPLDLKIKFYSGNKLLNIHIDKQYEDFSVGDYALLRLNFDIEILLKDLNEIKCEIELDSVKFSPKFDLSKVVSNVDFNYKNEDCLLININ